MLRKLFTLAAAVSAVMCVAACALWMRCRLTAGPAPIEFQRADGRWELVAERGRLRLDNAPQVRLDRVDGRLARRRSALLRLQTSQWTLQIENGQRLQEAEAQAGRSGAEVRRYVTEQRAEFQAWSATVKRQHAAFQPPPPHPAVDH